MIDIALLAIPVAFIILTGLLCWHVISAKGRWWVKLLLIVVVPSFGLAVWRSMPSYMGWPTAQRPEGKSLLLWAEVREPVPQKKDPGVIYVWLIPLEDGDSPGLLEYRDAAGKPRAHRLPYSRGSHEMVEAAKEMIKSGKRVVIEMNEPPPERDTDQEGSGRQGEGDRYNDPDGQQDFMMYELPPPTYPEKEP